MGSCTMEKCVILLSVLVLVWAPLGLSDEGHQVPDYCKLFPPTEPSKESCVKFIPQFFYNSTSQDCDTFIYGGCGGNKNRFRSHRSCMDTCHHGVVPVKPVTSAVEDCGQARSRHCDRTANDCNQAPDPGPCLAYFPQYFYNATTNECEIFIYGGCGGNNNRFESLAACKKNCRAEFNSTEVCHLPPKTGPCKAAFPKLYYNPESHRCEPFIYGGCDGNDNQFESIKDCMQTCHPEGNDVIITLLPEASMQLRGKPHACILPAESGPCRANLPRYFYNSATHRCEKFTYGGCGGNANKFVSARECNLVCHQNTQQQLTETAGTDPTDICHLPAEMGRCLALIPRYYYNHQTESCEVFNYGGCQGNQNNFVDEEQCMKTCKKD